MIAPNARLPSPEIFDRVPPQNLEAERGALGSLLLDPELCDEVTLVLRSADFYAPQHQALYKHLLAMHNDGLRIDATLLHERLKKSGDLEAIGGLAYLAEVADAVPTAHNAVHYAEIVRDKATLRSLIHACTEILRGAYDQTSEPSELVAKCDAIFLDSLSDHIASEPVPLCEALVDSLTEIDAIHREGRQRGLETGFPVVDRNTGGMQPGQLQILAARPGMGKSALASNIAEHVAVDCNQPVLFISLEMSRRELSNRMVCSAAKVNSQDAIRGKLMPEDRVRLTEAANRLSRGRLFIDDVVGRTVSEIASQARRFKRKHGLALLVIDYLQRIRAENPRDLREQQVAQMSARLKDLALELNIPILCLAQLNRQIEASGDHRPKLTNLRESGAIEQDADVVALIHRPDYYVADQEKHTGDTEIILAKVRGGATGVAKLKWAPVWCRFTDPTQGF